MNPRTKIILFIVVILLIVLIFGVGIGVKKGWFAGLADQISSSNGQATIKVKVFEKSPDSGTPMENVLVYLNKEPFGQPKQDCGNQTEDINPINGTKAGTTAKKNDGVYSTFSLDAGVNTEYFIRVEKDPLKSCAFGFLSVGGQSGNPLPAHNGHAVKLSGLSLRPGDIVTLVFATTAGGGTVEPSVEPTPEKGAIDGYVFGKNPIGGANIPVSGVNVRVDVNSTTTDANGHYQIGNLDKNVTYTVKFTAPTCSLTGGYQNPPDSSVFVAADSSPTNPTRVTPNPTVLEIGTSAQAYSVYGMVTDEITSNPISGAEVTLKAGPHIMTPSPVTTNADGFYMICPVNPALPPLNNGSYTGDYTLSVTAQGYRDGDPVTISGLHTAKNKRQDLALRTTPAIRGYFNITGVVYNGCSSSPILPPVASVKLQNLDGSIVILQSGQRAETTTGQQGDYQFNGIPITENPVQYKLFVARMSQDKTRLINISDVNDGQTFTVNTSLMSQNDLGSIAGRVVEKSTQAPINVRAGETLKVIIENPLDNSTQEIPVQSDGNFNATNIDRKHLGTPVKLKAVYTRTKNGQPKEYIGYAHIQTGLGDFVLLGCTMTGVKIEIDVSGQTPPTANEKKVIVLDQRNDGINDAQVTVAEWVVENDIGSWVDRATKTTSTITNPDGSTADGVAIFNHNYAIFKYTASKEGYGSAEKECKLGENCQTVIMHLKQGEDPVNPTSTDVEYVFQFFEGPKTTGGNQIKFAKAVAETFGIEYYDNFAENTPFAQQNVLGFIKKKIDSFERGKWQILPGGQWQTWQEFETWAKANAGVSRIEWDTAFVPGATAKKQVNKENLEYTVKVTFKDAASRNQFAATFFNQLQIKFVILGDNKDKITYDPASVDPRMYFPDEVNSSRIYITPLVFRFAIDAGYLKNIKLSEKAKRAVEGTSGGGFFGDIGRRIGGAIAGVSKFVIKEAGDITNTQGQQEETSSLRPGETLVGEYKFDENGAIFEPNFGVGSYRWEVTSFPKYKKDRRSDSSFSIGSNNESKMIDVSFCYADNGIYELNDQGLNYKYFGNLGNGYFRLSSAANLAKTTINKAQVNNILYLGDSITPLNTSGGYFDGSITFCQTTGGQSQDKVVSGKNIIVTDKLLTAINNVGTASQKNQILATKLTELSGYPIYNNLTSTQKRSWNRISRAVDATGNPSQVYQLFIAESQIENYINTNDIAAQPESLYSLAMAAYKNRGAIIKQRIEQMGSNSAEQNVAKAIVRYALETAGANGTTDNNLYQPHGRKLSQTIYSVAQIKSGNWLQSNYRSLSASGKISITYTQLISAIRGNKAADAVRAAIVSFNNWVDSLRGITNTGAVEGRVLRNGQPVKDVLVTIGNKVAVTNSNGDFRLTRVPMGSQVVDVKDRKTSATLPLKNPGMKVNVIKNQTITTTIRLNQQ